MTQAYRHPKRKFHDAWALVLFIICTVAANTVYILRAVDKPISGYIPKDLLIYSLVYLIVAITISSVFMMLFPEFFMHFSFIALPLILITHAIIKKDIISLVCRIIYGALCIFYYIFYGRFYIKYSAAVAKTTGKILLNNLFSIVPVTALCITALVAQMFIAHKHMDYNYQESYIIYVVCLLQMFWTFFALLYFMRVYVSSIVAYNVLMVDNLIIAFESMKNTLFCLGSICFGSLLVAAVSTLRTMNSRNLRERRDNIFVVILLIIIGVLLSLLEEILNYINEWVFVCIPYMVVAMSIV